MKPASFDYFRPTHVEEALELLADRPEGKLLAGGQSLVPLMNFRLARPDALIDLNGVQGLSGIEERDGALHIGAMTRLAELELATGPDRRRILLAAAARHVAHFQIRNRATIGGSVAHADPAAELPAVLLALDAGFHVRSPDAARVVAASDFFLGTFATALGADEILEAIALPAPQPVTWGFAELARRAGDFAISGVVCTATDEAVRFALFGVSDRPLLVEVGGSLSGRGAREAVDERLADIDVTDDLHGSAGYRRSVIRELAARAVAEAQERMRS